MASGSRRMMWRRGRRMLALVSLLLGCTIIFRLSTCSRSFRAKMRWASVIVTTVRSIGILRATRAIVCASIDRVPVNTQNCFGQSELKRDWIYRLSLTPSPAARIIPHTWSFWRPIPSSGIVHRIYIFADELREKNKREDKREMSNLRKDVSRIAFLIASLLSLAFLSPTGRAPQEEGKSF